MTQDEASESSAESVAEASENGQANGHTPNPVMQRRGERSVDEVAQMAGVSRQAVALAEAGRLKNPELVEKVAGALSWEAEDLRDAMAKASEFRKSAAKSKAEAARRKLERNRSRASSSRTRRQERSWGDTWGAMPVTFVRFDADGDCRRWSDAFGLAIAVLGRDFESATDVMVRHDGRRDRFEVRVYGVPKEAVEES